MTYTPEKATLSPSTTPTTPILSSSHTVHQLSLSPSLSHHRAKPAQSTSQSLLCSTHRTSASAFFSSLCFPSVKWVGGGGWAVNQILTFEDLKNPLPADALTPSTPCLFPVSTFFWEHDATLVSKKRWLGCENRVAGEHLWLQPGH